MTPTPRPRAQWRTAAWPETLLNAINDEIKALGKENFFHADYEATLVDTYGTDYEDSLVVEGGETSAQ